MEFVITGKKGAGKGIVAVGLINDYLEAGKPVATNLNLYLENLLPLDSKTTTYRLPDQPTYDDLVALGQVDTGGDERKNGLIVLDECANWLNARDYTDPNRKKLLDWFLHSRKFGWDVAYIIQNVNMLDKQFRDGFAEHVVNVIRLDRLPIPVLGHLLKFLGIAARLPQFHVGIVKYGAQGNAPVVDRWMYRGKKFWKAYDTLQRFTKDNEYQGLSCNLSAWHVKGRYLKWWDMYKGIAFLGFIIGVSLSVVLLLSGGYILGYERPKPELIVEQQEVIADERVLGYYETDTGQLIVTLSDGRIEETRHFGFDRKGVRAKIGNVWYTTEGKSK